MQGQLWFRQCCQCWLSLRSRGIHLRAILQEIFKIYIVDMSLKITNLILELHLPNELTHWGRVTHICVSKLTIIGSDNGLSPGRRQAIFWTNAGILLIRTLGTYFSEILSEIHAFSFKKMHMKMSSAKWRPFCLGLNVLTQIKAWPRWTTFSQATLFNTFSWKLLYFVSNVSNVCF